MSKIYDLREVRKRVTSLGKFCPRDPFLFIRTRVHKVNNEDALRRLVERDFRASYGYIGSAFIEDRVRELHEFIKNSGIYQ